MPERKKPRLKNFVIFSRYLFRYTVYVREVLFGLLLIIMLCGIAISYIERMDLGEAIYFAFVTGLSVGYGDIVPVTLGGRILSVLVGLIGVVFTGLVVAIATRALADATAHRWEELERMQKDK
ncbi:pH-gated potassium channel KcsA [Planctomycetes bacterium CA13]|uniref:pH-gated potassium channel KcsA n=1 Tax=Novipirellula herctigrandis TaxID=2527986 RepID=A0A5C5YWN4_9BACT|nr:pH-gated potassium channel KcsA [Planctomycetes bacterium CA13]